MNKNNNAKIISPNVTNAPPRLVEIIGHAAMSATQIKSTACLKAGRGPPCARLTGVCFSSGAPGVTRPTLLPRWSVHQNPRQIGQSRLKYCEALARYAKG